MSTERRRPDLVGLEAFALGQGGYFDRADAHRHGVSDRMLHHHARTGRFERVFPGVYRLAIAPVSPRDEYLLAWVWTNYRGALSHESALALYDLGDVVPSRVHVTVPRGFHRTTAPFTVHTAPLPDEDVQFHEGVVVTTPARSIVDAAASGTDPNQVHRAVREALERALTSPEKLRDAAARRGFNRHRRDVRHLIEAALSRAVAEDGRSPDPRDPVLGKPRTGAPRRSGVQVGAGVIRRAARAVQSG